MTLIQRSLQTSCKTLFNLKVGTTCMNVCGGFGLVFCSFFFLFFGPVGNGLVYLISQLLTPVTSSDCLLWSFMNLPMCLCVLVSSKETCLLFTMNMKMAGCG